MFLENSGNPAGDCGQKNLYRDKKYSNLNDNSKERKETNQRWNCDWITFVSKSFLNQIESVLSQGGSSL